jgi:hypothetical protein
MYVNAKMIPVDSVPVIRGGRRTVEEEFKYNIFDTL